MITMLRFVVSLVAFGFLFVNPLQLPALAQGQPEPFRPLVFIPGILGTELLDERGNVVWGTASSLQNFEKLELGASPAERPLHPGGLVKAINLLGPFWTVHQYDGLLSVLHGLNYTEGKNLFVLAYDWRASNFDTAQQLHQLIEGTPALKGREIDILAHSMGGWLHAFI